MTRVLVAVKRVADTSGEVVLTDDGQGLDRRFTGYTIGDHDSCAVELAIRVAEAFTSMDVKVVLDEVIKERGAPHFLRSDNGSEFIARDLGIWLAVQDVSTRFIEPGKPWQNGFAESFHSRLREECLTQDVFYSVKHAGVLIEGWRAFYNAHRPHSSLSYQTPDEFAVTWLAQSASHPVPCP